MLLMVRLVDERVNAGCVSDRANGCLWNGGDVEGVYVASAGRLVLTRMGERRALLPVKCESLLDAGDELVGPANESVDFALPLRPSGSAGSANGTMSTGKSTFVVGGEGSGVGGREDFTTISAGSIFVWVDRGGEGAATGMNGGGIEGNEAAPERFPAADRGTLMFGVAGENGSGWWYVGGSTGGETTIIAAELC